MHCLAGTDPTPGVLHGTDRELRHVLSGDDGEGGACGRRYVRSEGKLKPVVFACCPGGGVLPRGVMGTARQKLKRARGVMVGMKARAWG